ncbi:MAG: leucine-rich repeat protein [Actinomycetia bacterium]|nr:leucine-rich repeat protein [Actinomycetes bacterium]
MNSDIQLKRGFSSINPAFLVGAVIALTLLFMLVLFVPRCFASDFADGQGLEYTIVAPGQAVVEMSSGAPYSGSYTVPATYNGYTIIGVRNSAFDSCDLVTDVVLPEGLQSIGDAAFFLSGITSMNIPSTVTSIGGYAFAGTTSLASLTVAPGNPNYSASGGVLLDGSGIIIGVAGGLTSVTVPPAATGVGMLAFAESNAGSVVLPSGLMAIGYQAFYAAQLTSIDIPASVTSIDVSAFDSAPNLTSMTFRGTVPPALVDPDPAVGSFAGIPVGVTVHVPAGTTAYDSWATLYGMTIVKDLPAGGGTAYTVIFNNNDSATNPTTTRQTVPSGNMVTQPAAPTNGSYTFAGWYSDVNCRLPYNFSAPVISNFILYAGWQATVSFDANGGAPAPTAQMVILGQKVTPPASPALTGSTFQGWYNGATPFNFFAPVTGDVTLTAKWVAVSATQGVYAGAFLNGGDPANPGYLSWSGAVALNTANGDATSQALQAAGPHGGYVTSTVKCVVCHSVHRAKGFGKDANGVLINKYLTLGDDSCVMCHTTWGGGSASSLIEWGDPSTGAAGPHTVASDGTPATCTTSCHTGGVHGSGTSEFHAMNAWMLGSDKDAAIVQAFSNGNVNPKTITYNVPNGGLGADWFQNGTTPAPADGTLPVGVVNAAQFAAAKSTATGYTCAKSGCHNSGQFVVNAWGYSDANQLDPDGNTTSFTGHSSGMVGHTDLSDSGLLSPSCAPCHPGGLAGGYRTSETTLIANSSARSFGCDQCHDAVGIATNSTAFPHGNINVQAYEWNSDGIRTATGLVGGNLWMYASDIASVNMEVLQYAGKNDQASYYAAAQLGVDKSFKVIPDAVGTVHVDGGNISDAVCIKCHVPTDQASIDARGGATPFIGVAGRPHLAYVDGDGKFVQSTVADYPSDYIFLFK